MIDPKIQEQLLREREEREKAQKNQPQEPEQKPVTVGTDGEDPDNPNREKPKIVKMEEWLMLHYSFRRNLVTANIEFKGALEGDDAWREFQDEDEADVIYELKKMKFGKPEQDFMTIIKSNHIESHNPIAEYYQNLPAPNPAGQSVIRQLADCVRLENIECSLVVNGRMFDYRDLWNYYFEKWLKACYLCNMGVQKNDVMLILIGAQGRFKTSFLNNLCPKSMQKYIVCSNINPSLQDYNTATYLTDKMFINIDDQMENIFGKDYNSMKSIISQDFVSKRVLYSKRAKNRRRLANFMGSVNEAHFLRDSNNRRYLCFRIVDIDPKYREIDMDQVWSEVRLLVEGERSIYQFGKEDYLNIDAMNENFIAPSEAAEALRNIFKHVTPDDKTDVYAMQFSEILKVLRRTSENPQLKQYDLQTALRKMGFENRPIRMKSRGGMPVYLYEVQILTGASQMIADARTMCYQWRMDDDLNRKAAAMRGEAEEEDES